MIQAHKGDLIAVDSSVFIASPQKTGIPVACEVLQDSNESQTYIIPLRPHLGSPMFVFNNKIIKVLDNRFGDA